MKGKREAIPVLAYYMPKDFQEVDATRFVDNPYMKVVSLSALRTGSLYPPENIPVTHFC